MELIAKIIGIAIITIICVWFIKLMQRNSILNAITTIMALVFLWSIFNHSYDDEDIYIYAVVFVLTKLVMETLRFIRNKRSGVRMQIPQSLRIILTIILTFVAIAFICTGILLPLAYGIKEVIKLLWRDE